jgi:hypothetical protein
MTNGFYVSKKCVGGCLCAQEQTKNIQEAKLCKSLHLGCILFLHTEVLVGADPNWPQQWFTCSWRISCGEDRVRTRDGRNECIFFLNTTKDVT